MLNARSYAAPLVLAMGCSAAPNIPATHDDPQKLSLAPAELAEIMGNYCLDIIVSAGDANTPLVESTSTEVLRGGHVFAHQWTAVAERGTCALTRFTRLPEDTAQEVGVRAVATFVHPQSSIASSIEATFDLSIKPGNAQVCTTRSPKKTCEIINTHEQQNRIAQAVRLIVNRLASFKEKIKKGKDDKLVTEQDTIDCE